MELSEREREREREREYVKFWKLCWCLAFYPQKAAVVQVSLRDWCNSVKQAATVDKRLQRIRFVFVLPRTDSAYADTCRIVMVPDISQHVWGLNAETGESLSAPMPFLAWGDFPIVSCLL